jgi:predicted cupin superfamily sugar epimerase
MNRIAIIASCALLVSSFAAAQAPQQTSAPGVLLEHQRMGYFVGDWTATGTSKISPKTPAAPFTLQEHSEWVTGGYFVETKSSMKSELGTVNSQRVMGYNVEDKVYTYNVYNSLGEHQVALGHRNGATWIWDSEEKLNGIVIKGRYTIVETGPDTFTFKSEVADPKGGWVTVMEGKATRVAQQGN